MSVQQKSELVIKSVACNMRCPASFKVLDLRGVFADLNVMCFDS